jgi:hypothetical protein
MTETMIRVSWEELAAIELFAAICRDRGFEPDPWGRVPEGVKETTRGFVRVVAAVMRDQEEDHS